MTDRDEIFYKAYTSRDARFDGKFFCGVKTTGIYCRPICPAKPKRQNVEFFLDAPSAEKAGYRPCLRCHPECAPGSGRWIGKSATVKRALSLIEDRVPFNKNEEEFASLLGVSARHLRRLFEEELGQTPKQISDANRLNFARKLITETSLPITEVAFTSGFSSIRRFNEAFKSRFHRAPSELRRGNVLSEKGKFVLRLSYRPPFDFEGLLVFFQNHLVTGVEWIEDSSYNRIFKLDGCVGTIKVTRDESSHELILVVSTSEPKSLYQIVQKTRQLFDVDTDPLAIADVFKRSAVMKKLVQKYPGLRLPRSWDPFETAICAILGQLVSVKQARALVKELIVHYGEEVTDPDTGNTLRLFPSPQVLMGSNLEKIRTTKARRETIRCFAREVFNGSITLESAQDTQKFKDNLLQLPGIGPWTSEYISLRALGDTNAYPSTDLVLKRVAKRYPKIKADQFRPWRGYLAFYLWREFAK